ncbi:EAL domain-containing protein [Sphingomonas sp. TREG-RG-20F-R18-01]|uniref:EAL domain-containing protein n=1 Tax=Sphingomonas sp. TREG-RG-20F-R18-01 TaxID=2914982 RepID=UPI001F5A7B91|nr:EAL domain-containing protein [Sphingomonas sp. TREG-RG-20F-R18-01]
MTEVPGKPLDSGILFDALPTGVALLDSRHRIVDANASFWSAVSTDTENRATFQSLFAAEPAAFCGSGATIVLGDRHYTLVVRLIAEVGAVCHLHEVTDWVEGKTKATESSNCDTLTGLANRGAFLPELDRALEGRAEVALVMVDLDHFKRVNDTLGHPVGDALLRKVSERLTSALRKTDRVARLGGDEFAVLQCGAEQPHGAEMLAKRLVELVGRPYVIDGHMIDIGASVGVALSGTADDATALMKQADIALYRAKHAGRGRYCFFEKSMDAEMQERRALEIDLRRALAFRQFELHYQPQMDLKTQIVTGMEALIRWRHPERGLVSPATFIPLAEETGLIIPIGEWVIRQACEHAAAWASPIPVAVNVSAKQLASGKLINTVASALANSGLQPDRLEMEITESVLMSDVESCVATLHSLRDLGIRISMDDFGTGYSSLSYLQSFPFHTIKIDQSFIRSMDSEKSDGIIRAITAIGKHLGMTTIAEGVETAAQLDHVTDSGCGSAQGYLFSRPVPADKVAAMLERLAVTPVGQDDVSDAHESAAVSASIETGLYRLVYYSRNTIMGLEEEVRSTVDQILSTSQRNNAAVGVTGALMFTDGLFAQVLEGQRAAVETVFERIQLDDRHDEVQLLSFGPTDARVFPTWAMAFIGTAAHGVARFGHYAAASGFDFGAADGDQITSQLSALLLDEERLSVRAAA